MLAPLTVSSTAANDDDDRRELKAITALPSGMFSQRMGPDGKPMTAEQNAARLADNPTSGGMTAAGMGNPADKEILKSDDVLREINTSGEAGGNVSQLSSYRLADDMSSPTTTPTNTPMSARAQIDHQFESAAGRFRDATTERAMEFKYVRAGNDGLYTLGSPDPQVSSWSLDTASTPDPAPGTAYQIVDNTNPDLAITNAGVAGSEALGSTASVAAVPGGSPRTDQLWSVQPDPSGGDTGFQLVSRADGLCLTSLRLSADEGAPYDVTTDVCSDSPTQLFATQAVNGAGDVGLYPVPPDGATRVLVGSTNGAGKAGGLTTERGGSWSFRALSEPGGDIPTWSFPRSGGFTAGHTAAPYDMAVGDLDGIPENDAVAGGLAYHDETAVVFLDDNQLQLAVMDYNANSGHLLTTLADMDQQPRSFLAGTTIDGQYYPGDFGVGVGDFDNDGQNEIAAAFQEEDGIFHFSFWSYSAGNGSSRTITLDDGYSYDGLAPFHPPAGMTTTLATGYADLATGDFDGDAHDDVALAYATSDTNGNRFANLGVFTLGQSQGSAIVVGSETLPMPTGQNNLPPSLRSDPTRTGSGMRLVSGNLVWDPQDGYGPQRDSLALAYANYTRGSKFQSNGTDYYPYTVAPLVNIYTAHTGDCNSSGTSCDLTVAPTTGKDAMQPLFPQNPSKVAVRPTGEGYDAAPISMAAGGYGGQQATDPPVQGLAAGTWLEYSDIRGGAPRNYYTLETVLVPWAPNDDTGTQWTNYDTETHTGSNDNWTLPQYNAYDRDGRSLVLGAPAIMTVDNFPQLSLLAGQPPTHVDFIPSTFDGKDFKLKSISASDKFTLSTSTTSGKELESQVSHTHTTQHNARQDLDIKSTWSLAGNPLVDEQGYADVNQKFTYVWGGVDTATGDAATSESQNNSDTTDSDDLVGGSLQSTRLYRYPILGTPGVITPQNGEDCDAPCRMFYDVTVPIGFVTVDILDGQGVSWFQPSWENMNALSYPQIDENENNPVPMPDLGSYSYTDASGTTHSVNAPLYNSTHDVGGNSGSLTLNFSNSAGSGTSRSSDNTWDAGVDVTASGSVQVGAWTANQAKATLSVTLSGGYDESHGTGSLSSGTTTTTSDQAFTVNYPEIDEQFTYRMGTAVYSADNGAAKAIHGVDLTGNANGNTWWTQMYDTPDPGFNLPRRITLLYDPTNYLYDSPYWMTDQRRQHLRGFEVLQAQDDSTGLPTAGMPYTINPVTGEPVVFQVPVTNFSVAPMTAGTTVSWYVVPVTKDNVTVTGPPISIGSSDVPAIPAQGVVQVKSPTWTAPTVPATSQQYRVFAQIDPAGTNVAEDWHPLAGSKCDPTTLNDNPNTLDLMYDLMAQTQKPDPVGCGSNNQGYGLVTVDPTPIAPPVGVTGSRTPARVKLAGGGLDDQNPAHLHLTEDSAVPTIPHGQQVTGLVHASAAETTSEHPAVLVYDGPPADGNLIAVTEMPGVNAGGGGTASFDWTPTRPGLHELHQVLLGTSGTGEDDEQIMRVNVARPLTPYHVRAHAKPSSVKRGARFSIVGRYSPVPPEANERAVHLQRRTGAGWKTVATKKSDSTGSFAFFVKAAGAGTYRYRVIKERSTGRIPGMSRPVNVVVGRTGALTLRAPATVQQREALRLSGRIVSAPTSGAWVTIQQRQPGHGWNGVARVRVGADGRYSHALRAQHAGLLRFRARSTDLGLVSPVVDVEVKGRR